MRQVSSFLSSLMLGGVLFFANSITAQTINIGANATPSIPNLTTAIAQFGAGFQNLQGQTINVNGLFEVNLTGANNNWSLDEVEVLYTSTGKIRVLTNCSMSATNATHFQGSFFAVTAIEAQSQCTLQLSNCSFDGTGTGVSISGSNVSFDIQSCVFNINGTSTGLIIGGLTQDQNIHLVSSNTFNVNATGTGISLTTSNTTNTASSIRLNRNTIQASTFAAGSTGIRISPNVSEVSILGTGTTTPFRFTRLGFGVSIEKRATNITLDQTRADGCGTAVQTLQSLNRLTITNSRFFNCVNDCIKIQDHEFKPIGSATLITNAQSVTIETNRMHSENRSGILIRGLLSSTGWFNVVGNFITPETGDMGSAPVPTITNNYGISIQTFKAAFVRIVGNQVMGGFTGSVAGGIWLNNGWASSRCIVRNNTVLLNEALQLDFAIGTTDCLGGVQIVGNHILNSNIPPIDYNHGILMDNTPDAALLCCNDINRARDGILFTGVQNDYRIFNTTFNKHSTALHYEMAAPFGCNQLHRGNLWVTNSGGSTQTTLDAIFNGNASFVFQSLYRVNTSHLPNPNKVSVNGAGNANNWFLNESESEATCENGEDAFCGDDPLELTDPPEEFINDGDEWAANPQSEEQYNAVHWTAQRNLYGKLMRNTGFTNSSEAIFDFYSDGQSGNLGKFYSIEMGVANLHDNEVSDSIIAIILADLQSINTGIVTTTEPEANLKSMNAVLLSALLNDDWDFSTAEKASIDTVASFCPQVGGSAVYLARQLQENWRQPDWSLSECTLPSERSSQSSITSTEWVFYPNPASDMIHIRLPEVRLNESLVAIFDLTGKLAVSARIPVGEETASIPLNDLPPGTWFVRIIGTDDLRLLPQKLTILR